MFHLKVGVANSITILQSFIDQGQTIVIKDLVIPVGTLEKEYAGEEMA